MAKHLYLLRHGEAEQGLYGSDFKRKLTERGISRLRSLGMKMKQKSFFPEKVYCSTALRTRESVDVFLEQLACNPRIEYLREIYEASVKTLFDLIVSTDNSISTLLIVGHNPGISYLVEYLTESNYENLSPGELVSITFQESNWAEISKGLGIRVPI